MKINNLFRFISLSVLFIPTVFASEIEVYTDIDAFGDKAFDARPKLVAREMSGEFNANNVQSGSQSASSRQKLFILDVNSGTVDIVAGAGNMAAQNRLKLLVEEGKSNTYRIYSDIDSFGEKAINAKPRAIAEDNGKGTVRLYTDIDAFGDKKINAKPKLVVEVSDDKGVARAYTDIDSFGGKEIMAKPVLIVESSGRQDRKTLLALIRFMTYNW